MRQALDSLIKAGAGMLPVAAVFIALALITKRGAILAAWRRCRRETLTNIAIALLDVLVVAPAVILPVNWLARALGPAPTMARLWTGLPVAAICLAAVVLGDLIGYWRHRFEHSRLLWPAHATHHSDEAMSWLTLNRMHPLNRLSTTAIDAGMLTLLGLPPAALVFNNLIRNWWGYFIHADLGWTMGPLGRVMISPGAHRIHHARSETLAGANFATMFTAWDKLFGTWREPVAIGDVPTGIESGSLAVPGELARPFVALWRWVRQTTAARTTSPGQASESSITPA